MIQRQDPQEQSAPQVQVEQVQLGLSQPAVGLPQLQSASQVQVEQVPLGLSQRCCVVSVMV